MTQRETRCTDLEPGLDEAHVKATFSRHWRASWGVSYTDAMADPAKRAEIIAKARETTPHLRRRSRGDAVFLDQKRRASGERDDDY
jgi:hypothetical protein